MRQIKLEFSPQQTLKRRNFKEFKKVLAIKGHNTFNNPTVKNLFSMKKHLEENKQGQEWKKILTTHITHRVYNIHRVIISIIKML